MIEPAYISNRRRKLQAMQINQVTVIYGRKVNLGDYNNANLEISFEAELDLDDDPLSSANRLWEMARESVKEQELRLTKKGKEEAGAANRPEVKTAMAQGRPRKEAT